MGDTVNAAFRMQACTREVQTHFAIGPATLAPIGTVCDPIEFLDQQCVPMKGYGARRCVGRPLRQHNTVNKGRPRTVIIATQRVHVKLRLLKAR